MSKTPVFDSLLDQYPGIHRASNIFPHPPEEPFVSFIKEKGTWISKAQHETFLKMVRWSWS